MFPHQTFRGDGAALPANCRAFWSARDGGLGLPWVEQRPALDRFGEAPLRARREAQSKSRRTQGRGSAPVFRVTRKAMGLFDKFKAGLRKTHSKLAHEIKRIIT